MNKAKKKSSRQAGHVAEKAARDEARRITVTIDGQQIETEPGRNLVQVANENDIFIPSQ